MKRFRCLMIFMIDEYFKLVILLTTQNVILIIMSDLESCLFLSSCSENINDRSLVACSRCCIMFNKSWKEEADILKKIDTQLMLM